MYLVLLNIAPRLNEAGRETVLDYAIRGWSEVAAFTQQNDILGKAGSKNEETKFQIASLTESLGIVCSIDIVPILNLQEG